MFQDITTLLLDHKAFKHTIDIFVDRYKDMHISLVAGKTSFVCFFFSVSFFYRHYFLLNKEKKSIFLHASACM